MTNIRYEVNPVCCRNVTGAAYMNDRKVAGAIYALKDCHMCNLNPQIGAFPRCVGIYLTNDI